MYDGCAADSLVAMNRVPTRAPAAPAASTAARERPLPMPPAARTGISTASRTSLSKARTPILPRMWPPASIPCAIMKSHPASRAARASRSDPTCQEASAPPECTRSTSARSGSPQKKSQTLALPAASRTLSRSRSGIRKFTPNGRAVRSRIPFSFASRTGAPAPASVTIPSPPASETAAASSAVSTRPIPASWIGTEQPTRRVNLVDSIGVPLPDRFEPIWTPQGASAGPALRVPPPREALLRDRGQPERHQPGAVRPLVDRVDHVVGLVEAQGVAARRRGDVGDPVDGRAAEDRQHRPRGEVRRGEEVQVFLRIVERHVAGAGLAEGRDHTVCLQIPEGGHGLLFVRAPQQGLVRRRVDRQAVRVARD